MLRDIWVKLGWEPAARTNRQTEQKNRAHTFALKTPHVIPACKKKSFQNLHRAPPIPTAPIAALLFSDEKPTGEKPPRQSRVQLKVRSFNHLAAGCLPFFICSCLHTRLPCLPTPPRVTPPLDHAAAGALWMNARTRGRCWWVSIDGVWNSEVSCWTLAAISTRTKCMQNLLALELS